MADLSPALEKQILALGLEQEACYAALPAGCLLPMGEIQPNDFNRKHFKSRIAEIAGSLKQVGWQPNDLALVWRDPAGKVPYTIINGEHRWMIARLCGFTQFPALVANVTNREDAMLLNATFEVARGRLDKQGMAKNLAEIAARGDRDEWLRVAARIKDPEAIRATMRAQAERVEMVRAEAKANAAPRLLTLALTAAQYEAWQLAIGKAKTRLKLAAETIGMVEELADRDIVAIAAVMRERHGRERG